jgi:hypothetical protein
MQRTALIGANEMAEKCNESCQLLLLGLVLTGKSGRQVRGPPRQSGRGAAARATKIAIQAERCGGVDV